MASGMRFLAPDWDGGIAAHPDERYLLGVGVDVPLGANVCLRAPDFPYGTLPVLLVQLLARCAPGQDPLYAARLASALAGVVAVVLAFGLGRELAGARGGVLAAAVTTLSPFLIQQAHFYTVDPLGMALVSAAALAAVRRRWSLAGALTGLAVGCKLSLAIAAIPLIAAAVLSRQRQSHPSARWLADGLGSSPARMVSGAVASFLLVSPWSLLTPVACWRGPLIQSLMASGRYEVPYTLQYARTVPYLYPLAQMALWGTGIPATALGLWGLVHWLRAGRSLRRALRSPAWGLAVIYLLVVGGLSVKFPRYMLPLYPVWAAWAAYTVMRTPIFGRGSRSVLTCVTVAAVGAIGFAQVGIYSQPHPWVVASQQIYAGAGPGAVIVNEAWDHPLPVPLPGSDDGRFLQLVAPVYDIETHEKLMLLRDLQAQAEVLVLSSQRGYGALARRDERFGQTSAWYAEALRTRRVEAFARCPRLGPVAITDDPLSDAHLDVGLTLAEICGTRWALRLPRLDESYRVYDAPLTLLLWPRR